MQLYIHSYRTVIGTYTCIKLYLIVFSNCSGGMCSCACCTVYMICPWLELSIKSCNCMPNEIAARVVCIKRENNKETEHYKLSLQILNIQILYQSFLNLHYVFFPGEIMVDKTLRNLHLLSCKY